MNDSYFYVSVSKNSENQELINKIESFAQDNCIQTYIIDKPLGERKYEYEYKRGLLLLIPKFKLLFVNFGEFNEKFENYCEDFIEDLGYISDKYGYKKVLGRPRNWRDEYFEQVSSDELIKKDIKKVLHRYKLDSKETERNCEYLISLLTGSINDIDRLGEGVPNNILDKIKRKIVLFDGDQTRFIYQEPTRNRITIQGLAGTGKTELLLHKLKDLYTKETNTKIVFTCHNKILSESLKERIPEFFNFMKVDEQIKWNVRLWTMSSWGSGGVKNSGVYSYICEHYRIRFERYSYFLSNSFESVCQNALNSINKIENFEPCFDYILIDESQDFPEAFFRLCEKVTRYSVYVAGDIFQNVFDANIISKVTPDFLLNKCYRTDPRTLMFAHAIGMGLFEEPKLRWLKDDEWEACGYTLERTDENCNLFRKTLRRFEDLQDEQTDSIKLIVSDENNYVNKVMNILENIVDENPTVTPDDIGIIFLENMEKNYQLTNLLQVKVKQRFKWDVNIGYESKTKYKDTLFISNRNNVKGLEFPFIICIMQSPLRQSLQQRNSLYMMLTRSFITTYFIVSDENGEMIDTLNAGIKFINQNGYLSVKEPTSTEKERLNTAIINSIRITKSHYDITEDIMDKLGVKTEYREKLHQMVEVYSQDEFDENKVFEFIKLNYNLFV